MFIASTPVAVRLPRPKTATEAAATLNRLILSYRHIASISNISDYSMLKVLRLDNNGISTIHGLDTLVDLETLDLSFNRISKIQGLGNLVRLTDVSLFSNKISTLEGLDTQKHTLECLSIGRNDIKDMSEVLKVKELCPNVKVLSLEGCPFAVRAGADYRSLVLALLPQLSYLDWSATTAAEVHNAKEVHARVLLDIRDREREQEEEYQRIHGCPMPGSAAAVTGANVNGMMMVGGAGFETNRSEVTGRSGVGTSNTSSPNAAQCSAMAAALKDDIARAGAQHLSSLWPELESATSSVMAVDGGSATQGGNDAVGLQSSQKASTASLMAGGMIQRSSAASIHSHGNEHNGSSSGLNKHGRVTGITSGTEYLSDLPDYIITMKALKHTVVGKVDASISALLAIQAETDAEAAALEYALNEAREANDVEGLNVAESVRKLVRRLLRAALDRNREAALDDEEADELQETKNRYPASVLEHNTKAGRDVDYTTAAKMVREAAATARSTMGRLEMDAHEQCITALTAFDSVASELAVRRGNTTQSAFRGLEKDLIESFDKIKGFLSISPAGGADAGDSSLHAGSTTSSSGAPRDRQHQGGGSLAPHRSNATTTTASHGRTHAQPHHHSKNDAGSARGDVIGEGGGSAAEAAAAAAQTKAAALAMAAQAHEARMDVLTSAEEASKKEEKAREVALKGRVAAELSRHRERIVDINAFYNECMQQAAQVEAAGTG